MLKLARPTNTGEITDEVYADWTTTYPELDGRSKAQVAQFRNYSTQLLGTDLFPPGVQLLKHDYR